MFKAIKQPTPQALHTAAENALECARAEVDRAAELLQQSKDVAHDQADTKVAVANALYQDAVALREHANVVHDKLVGLPNF